MDEQQWCGQGNLLKLSEGGSKVEKRVLSIQSHVTHGYVGNRAAVFPLQLHGFDVGVVNAVSLSNHGGYPVITGHRMDLAEYQQLFEGLRRNDFLKEYSYVLTGYINNADIIRNISTTLAEVREAREASGLPRPTYICDPVMGDDGKMYCKEDVVEAYRDILHLADIATPNFFEASKLSGVDVVDMSSAIKAADWFHSKGTWCVVIKSFKAPGDDKHLNFLVSFATRDTSGDVNLPYRRYTGKVPYHPGRYTGTGDVFAACFLAFYHDNWAGEAVSKAMGVLQDVIRATCERGGEVTSSLKARELRVMDVISKVQNPSQVFEALPYTE